MKQQPADTPLVSIICLTYNHERFVSQALRGILAQAYRPLEIIIMDDGSTDSTVHIISRELSNHPDRTDIRLVRNERNLGELGRQNTIKGIGLSTGNFIILAAGDDEMLPSSTQEMVDVWISENASLVTVNAAYIDEDSNELGRYYQDLDGPHDDSFETLLRDGANATCFGAGIGFERALYDEFGWQPDYLKAYDIALPFHAYLAKGARFIPKVLLKYRVHNRNTSLSLEVARSEGIDALLAEEQIYYGHLAHAFYMESELQRLRQTDPSRFSEVATFAEPLLSIQQVEMGRKLVNARIRLNELGVSRFRPA